eukprot:CAMPEP_0115704172 /NCGR_PEP_ID=MMETSP0272-20121206/69511_1 /TAXON_ID=71861 /ORGANISM="Scrippsiella trochoidea, Strain CCMP3099" /LENGTH=978 /DNA_ID=CAMNT_0003145127 /DNA_START=1 /DNA_END=2937 /DNA_ORIENTATION=-
MESAPYLDAGGADVAERCDPSIPGAAKSPRVSPHVSPRSATGAVAINNGCAARSSVDSAVPFAILPSAADSRTVWKSLAQQADLLASRGNYSEALRLVDEALHAEPHRAELHLGRGQCLGHLGRLADALVSFERALRLDPVYVAAMRGKAAVLAKQQCMEGAVASLREAIRAVLAAAGGEVGGGRSGTSDGAACSGGFAEIREELARCLTEQGVQLKSAGQGRPQLFQEAVEACETYAPAHFQLGVEASETGDSARAKERYTRAVQLHPGYVEAWNNLGVACRTLGEPEHAVEAYGMALKVNQNCKKTRENMAMCLLELGCNRLQARDWKKASSFLKRALLFNAHCADIYFNLAVMYAERHKLDRAKVNYELAIHFDPQHANAHNNLGVIHRRQSNLDAAIHCFQQALDANPKMNLANKNLGAVYGTMGRMTEAIALTRAAIDANPQDAEAYNNLALLYLRDQCDVDSCLEHLSACLRLEPNNPHASSNHLMSLNYPSSTDPCEVFESHRSWGERIEAEILPKFTAWNVPTRGVLDHKTGNPLPLRIGYVSPDFYTHSVSYFIHAALRYHDPAFVHVTCYSDVSNEDDKTKLFRSFVPRWRTILGMSDEEAANLIHADGIEVLVELTGHTGHNRLSMLARRPAPVIVTWMGYPHTTGLTRVDYRISDEHADPASAPGYTTEKIVYLPDCFLCYTPPDNAPMVSLRPAQETYGSVTFGCFNNLAKVSTLTVCLWSRLLLEVPNSRLFLKSKALMCPEVQDRFRRAFASCGVDGGRVDLSGLQPHTGSHLQMYNLVDVALDTLPYAGTTTTCEALYMGVPVVTLRGHRIHAQNVGASLLAAVQLNDLVARTEDEFVQKAAGLAQHKTRLAALRAVQRSVLCDGPRHAARLERLLARLAAEWQPPAASVPTVATATPSASPLPIPVAPSPSTRASAPSVSGGGITATAVNRVDEHVGDIAPPSPTLCGDGHTECGPQAEVQ